MGHGMNERRQDRRTVFLRKDGLWDWHIVAPNGEIIATSGGQGFTERNDAAEAMDRAVPTPGANGVGTA